MDAKIVFSTLVAVALIGCSGPAEETPQNDQNDSSPDSHTLRVATFNASLYRDEAGQLVDDLSDPEHQQAREIAEIIQIQRPDVILINEFDYDDDHAGVELFAENFLEQPQRDQEAIEYPYYYAFESNTGKPSGKDLGDSGEVAEEEGTEEYAQDAFGYGKFPGQYAFAVFSKYPLQIDEARSFREFLWKDMPADRIPRDFYDDDEIEILRLSSKNHVDLPIDVEGHRLHLLASHPTPPAFDGPEQRNVRRNQDEIRLWHDYIRPDEAGYIYDDDGETGGLHEDAYFVIAGDLNADPYDSDALGAVSDLLEDERTLDPKPTSEGAEVAGEQAGGANEEHEGPHDRATSDWHDSVGNMRVDYAVPSSNLAVEDSAVFWPAPGEDYAELVEATDHRLVWVDITLGD